LLLMLKLPLREPLPVGWNETLTVQLSPTSSTFKVGPQVLVCTKSPLALMRLIFSVEVPVLVNVTVLDSLTEPTFRSPNDKLVGETLAAVEAATPVPVTVMVWGLSGALSVMLISSVAEPKAEGVKVMLIVQYPAPLESVPMQLSVSKKSPLVVISVMVSGALPALMTDTVCGALLTLRA
jgi:hypothetical protein